MFYLCKKINLRCTFTLKSNRDKEIKIYWIVLELTLCFDVVVGTTKSAMMTGKHNFSLKTCTFEIDSVRLKLNRFTNTVKRDRTIIMVLVILTHISNKRTQHRCKKYYHIKYRRMKLI